MKKPCSTPGCPALIDAGRHCAKHAPARNNARRDYEAKRQADPVLAESKRFRNSAAWQKVRRLKFSVNPICEDPFGDHQRACTTASADHAHHIKPLASHPELGLHLNNLMSVCTRCHSRLETAVRREQS